MIADMGHDLEMVNSYDWVAEGEPQMERVLVDIVVDVILFWVQTTRFLRRHPIVNLANTAWPAVCTDFDATLSRIRKRLAQLKDRAEALSIQKAAMIAKQASGPATATVVSDGSLPCIIIPFPRNTAFYGRELELKSIKDALDQNPKALEYKILALIGMGGVGKTQIALNYAFRRADSGVKAVFWVNSETSLTVAESYTEIAMRLQLEGASADGAHLKNRYLVSKWFQQTKVEWLVIFDNVEDLAVLDGYWPTSPRGSILITSRHENVALEVITQSLKISPFSAEQGSTLILKTLHRNSYSEDEKKGSEALSTVLGGLALAITVATMQIRLKRMPIQKFVQSYIENRPSLQSSSKIKNVFYKHSLDTVWKTAFSSMDSNAAFIFDTACFCAPDNVPMSIFEHPVPGLQHEDDAGTSYDLEDGLESLLLASLVTQDELGDISIHRVLQEEYRKWLGPECQLASFKRAAKLLLGVFPRQKDGRSMHLVWSICRKYISHVVSLAYLFKRNSYKSLPAEQFCEFVELCSYAAWYLFEISSYKQCTEFAVTAIEACGSNETLLLAHLSQTAGYAERERGHPKEAEVYLERAKTIRERLLPPNHPEIANIYSSLAGVYISSGKYDEGLKLFQEAVKIDLTTPYEEHKSIIFRRYLNMSTAERLKGKPEAALEYVELATPYILDSFGAETHFDVTQICYRGSIAYDMNDLPQAQTYYEHACRGHVKEQEFHPAHICANYKLACTEIKLGRINRAIDRLRYTQTLCEVCEASKGDKGDTARIKRKLAEALMILDEKDAEAAVLKEEAESIRAELQGAEFSNLPDNDHSYSLLVAHYFR
ncbi:hypothetical protein N7493_009708 [Penicillium malachiteum]|uniref:NB-ARC domain-containing protein n=1 Tax=Penicillium malachiteum TaxID=1324776 RepID=A0AAD6HEP9_9EURO|nr:hypothetical protein N7493_009708 [Penicillium malachiteum]